MQGLNIQGLALGPFRLVFQGSGPWGSGSPCRYPFRSTFRPTSVEEVAPSEERVPDWFRRKIETMGVVHCTVEVREVCMVGFYCFGLPMRKA